MEDPVAMQSRVLKLISRTLLAAIAHCTIIVINTNAHSERLLASQNDLSAVLANDYKCSKTVPIIVRAKKCK